MDQQATKYSRVIKQIRIENITGETEVIEIPFRVYNQHNNNSNDSKDVKVTKSSNSKKSSK